MIYFTSDQHYWHSRVIQYCSRPYSSVEEMNENMIVNWNNTVGPDDEVYCLGDFSLAFRPIELYSARLMGKKHLVPGNHDMLHSFHKRSRNKENQEKWIQKYKDYGWNVLPEQTKLEIDGLTFELCHHPYATEYELQNGDKYAKWRPEDNGNILLCGHVHEKYLHRYSPKGTLMINVGVDVWDYKPVSIDQILQLIEEENGKKD